MPIQGVRPQQGAAAAGHRRCRCPSGGGCSGGGQRNARRGRHIRTADGFVFHWTDDPPVGLLKGWGAELVRGHGRLDGSRRVAVETLNAGRVVLSARHAVAVCTGSRAALPNTPGITEARPWISRDATSASAVPERLAIVGGGGVGVEMSSAYQGLGASVTLLVRDARLLPEMEPFVGEVVARGLVEAGFDNGTAATVTGLSRPGGTGPV